MAKYNPLNLTEDKKSENKVKTDKRKEDKIKKETQQIEGIEAPKTKMVQNEDGAFSEVQTNTDTKNVEEVPKVTFDHPKKDIEGERTSLGNFTEDGEGGVKEGEVNKVQAKEIWGAEVNEGEEEGNEDITEEPKKPVPPEDLPPVPPPPEPPKPLKPTDENVKKVVDKIRVGITRDYKNGFFGDPDTVEAKEKRNKYLIDLIGTNLANMLGAFSGKDRKSALYRDIIDSQDKNIIENENKVRTAKAEEKAKRVAMLDNIASTIPQVSEGWKNLSEEEKAQFGQYMTFVGADVNNPSTWLQMTNKDMFDNFSNTVKVLTTEEGRKAILDNENIKADISKIRAETGWTEEKTRETVLDIQKKAIQLKYVDAKEVTEIAENIARTLGLSVDIVKDIVNMVTNPAGILSINKGTEGVPKPSKLPSEDLSPKGNPIPRNADGSIPIKKSSTKVTTNAVRNKK